MGNETVTPDLSGEDSDFIHVRVDKEMKIDARVAAAQRDLSISEYIRDLIREDTGNEE